MAGPYRAPRYFAPRYFASRYFATAEVQVEAPTASFRTPVPFFAFSVGAPLPVGSVSVVCGGDLSLSDASAGLAADTASQAQATAIARFVMAEDAAVAPLTVSSTSVTSLFDAGGIVPTVGLVASTASGSVATVEVGSWLSGLASGSALSVSGTSADASAESTSSGMVDVTSLGVGATSATVDAIFRLSGLVDVTSLGVAGTSADVGANAWLSGGAAVQAFDISAVSVTVGADLWLSGQASGSTVGAPSCGTAAWVGIAESIPGSTVTSGISGTVSPYLAPTYFAPTYFAPTYFASGEVQVGATSAVCSAVLSLSDVSAGVTIGTASQTQSLAWAGLEVVRDVTAFTYASGLPATFGFRTPLPIFAFSSGSVPLVGATSAICGAVLSLSDASADLVSGTASGSDVTSLAGSWLSGSVIVSALDVGETSATSGAWSGLSGLSEISALSASATSASVEVGSDLHGLIFGSSLDAGTTTTDISAELGLWSLADVTSSGVGATSATVDAGLSAISLVSASVAASIYLAGSFRTPLPLFVFSAGMVPLPLGSVSAMCGSTFGLSGAVGIAPVGAPSCGLAGLAPVGSIGATVPAFSGQLGEVSLVCGATVGASSIITGETTVPGSADVAGLAILFPLDMRGLGSSATAWVSSTSVASRIEIASRGSLTISAAPTTEANVVPSFASVSVAAGLVSGKTPSSAVGVSIVGGLLAGAGITAGTASTTSMSSAANSAIVRPGSITAQTLQSGTVLGRARSITSFTTGSLAETSIASATLVDVESGITQFSVMAGVLPLAAPSAAVGVAMIGSIVAGIGIAPVPAPTSDISADAVVDPVKARAHVRTLFVGESVADCGALAGSIDVALPVQSDVAIWSFVDVAAYLGDVGLVGLWRARKESYFRDFIPNFTETVFPLETILETSYPEVGPDVPDYPEFGPEVPDYPDR